MSETTATESPSSDEPKAEPVDQAEAAPVEQAGEESDADARVRLASELGVIIKQRDFLSGQCASLIERLAGAHVAAGLINMGAAQGFVQKEILPVNNVLAQMAAQGQAEGEQQNGGA